MNKRIKSLLVLIGYIIATTGLYYGVCYLRQIPFTELHLLYAALIGCVAYLPRFITEWKTRKNR